MTKSSPEELAKYISYKPSWKLFGHERDFVNNTVIYMTLAQVVQDIQEWTK